ncbi:hypothetical protein DM860_011333 [Cuscuta australis]|uniref:DUF679 domain-containing protein n=1 Tax=Cuscuta australis TaxID=267555 RepID=A0A328DPK4_9ASTE|nr:hypothetical protein DM860_011333 [Cuscuta australis]
MENPNSDHQRPLLEDNADIESNAIGHSDVSDDDIFYSPDDFDDDDNEDDSKVIRLFNAVLSGTARLNVLLPTATILAFIIFAPLLTNDGNCSRFDRFVTGFFLAISAASCVFFSLTDRFKTARGRLRYGVATPRGIRTFGGSRVGPMVPNDYKLRWSDLFHVSLSLVAFSGFVFSQGDVLQCYRVPVSRKAVNVVPLVVGFVVSVLFVTFPSRRRGIGFPFLLQSEIFNSRSTPHY